ncbi:hypothetical protein IJ750_06310 [bacterium]|nr:hypothetical protein [bacterium]
MQIQTTQHNNNFKSGLNKSILADELTVNTKKLQRRIEQKYRVDAYLGNNSGIAVCLKNALTIFNELSKKADAQFFKIDFPSFSVFDDNSLLIGTLKHGFCIPESQLVIKGKKIYKTGSIFQHKIRNLEEWNSCIEDDYAKGIRSSNHFLSETIHEILHSIYLRFIYTKYGYNGFCHYTREKYKTGEIIDGSTILQQLETKSFSKSENDIIQHNIGKYATGNHNQYHEVFAETFTKLICNCLDINTNEIIKNPFCEIKRYPKEFLQILKKVLTV